MNMKKLALILLMSVASLFAVSYSNAADSKPPAGTILGMKSHKKPSALVYVDVQSGKVHELLPDHACGPCFSPDGQNIAFIYQDMIYVAPRNDIEARREVLPTKGSYNKHLSWTNDDFLYFGEEKAIYRVSIKGGDKEKVADMPSQMTQKKGKFSCLSVSNDGKRAAWWDKTMLGGSGMTRFPSSSLTQKARS